MNEARERRRLELLAQGLDLPGEARAAWAEDLQEREGFGATALLGMIAEAESGLGDFLAAPLVQGPVVPVASLPELLGFEILELLGEGGMGAVYLAQQETPVRRRVALKVLRSALGTPRAVVRFEAERQALARLRHPNVAALYEAGETQDAYPWFAMEWVDGGPVTEFCDRERLTIRDRVRLFLDVCRGVQHAHEKQLLHRDLKASNVLVTLEDGRPVPKIIDFGIALSLDPEVPRLTAQGLLGTPESLPPEAIAAKGGELDTRADVYALGILLYELLVGARPYEASGSSLAALLRRIEEGRAVAPSLVAGRLDDEVARDLAQARGTTPSGLQRCLEKDLDWIVLRAIAREPHERYGSAAELGEDLQRFLASEPVRAAPPGALYRLRKAVRRHRRAVAAVVVVVASLVVGVVGATLGLLRARSEAESTRRALAETQEMADFLGELFTAADPERAQGQEISARELLDQGATRIAEAFPDQPAARARFLRTIGDIYVRLGSLDDAAPLLTEASRLLEAAAQDPAARARALHSLAVLADRKGRLEDAAALYRRALELWRTVSSPDLRDVARTHHNLGVACYRLGLDEEAESEYRRGLELRRQTLDANDPDIATSLSALGVLALYRRDDLAGAEGLLDEALRIREVALGPWHPHVGVSLQNLCILRRKTRQLDDAEAACRRAAEITRRAYGDAHGSTSHALRDLGGLLLDQGRFAEALPLLQEAVEIQRRATGTGHPDYLERLTPLADGYWYVGDLDRAEAVARESLTLRTETLGADHWSLAMPLRILGAVAWKRGRLEDARELLLDALGRYESQYGSGTDRAGIARLALAGVERDRARRDGRPLDEARRQLDLAGRALRARYPPGHLLLQVWESEAGAVDARAGEPGG